MARDDTPNTWCILALQIDTGEETFRQFRKEDTIVIKPNDNYREIIFQDFPFDNSLAYDFPCSSKQAIIMTYILFTQFEF